MRRKRHGKLVNAREFAEAFQEEWLEPNCSPSVASMPPDPFTAAD
jgi:hypothetical protein